ncbi:MAG TPA: DnaD domain protein [Dehalococcoidia bacterium]|nr:DnaD domain protein [Dehalococcoidia bacterium]
MRQETREDFAGFPNSGLATAVPNLFFSRIMPGITDPAELVVSVYFFFSAQLHQKRHPRVVSRDELAADRTLVQALANVSGGSDGEALSRGLDLAVRRGSLIRARGGDSEVYAVNNPANYRALESAGDMQLEEALPPAPDEPAPDIFTLYEANIGSITPLIADDLKDAEARYPAEWIRAAIRESAELNKRSWRYVASILRRWETEGRDHEESQRDPQIDWLERRFREGKRPARPGA